MDDQASKRWLETMRREKNAKIQWEAKYLTAEDLQRSQEEQDALGAIEAAKPPPGKRLTERDVMMQRLSVYATPEAEEEPPPKMPYQLQRERIAREVAASRPRAHRLTRDLTTPALLSDMGPGLWISINPGYVHANKSFFTSNDLCSIYTTKYCVRSPIIRTKCITGCVTCK